MPIQEVRVAPGNVGPLGEPRTRSVNQRRTVWARSQGTCVKFRLCRVPPSPRGFQQDLYLLALSPSNTHRRTSCLLPGSRRPCDGTLAHCPPVHPSLVSYSQASPRPPQRHGRAGSEPSYAARPQAPCPRPHCGRPLSHTVPWAALRPSDENEQTAPGFGLSRRSAEVAPPP